MTENFFSNAEIKRLFNENERLGILINAVLDGIIISGEQGEILVVNDKMQGIYGYELSQIMGLHLTELIPKEIYLNNAHLFQEEHITQESFIQRQNGESCPVEIRMVRFLIENRDLIVVTVRDISELKREEQEIQKYIENLNQSNQDLHDYAYIASHDLKEPLRGLSNNAFFLKEDHKDCLKSEDIENIDHMIVLCEQMEKFINNLLFFAELEDKKLNLEKVDLNDIIRSIITTIVDDNVNIEIHRKLPIVVCDQELMKIIFKNLIFNAIENNIRDKKNIQIGFKNKSGYIFYIKDNGIGIREENYENIFHILRSFDYEDMQSKPIGMGLVLVKKIIDLHLGKIWLESEIGVGTTFYFNIGG